MSVRFHQSDVNIKLPQKRALSAFLQSRVLHYLEGIRKVDLEYIFCSDEYLLRINQDFLKHDTFTDIITFDLSESENEVRGEIYVSTDRVAENAQRYSVSFQEELHRVIFHGMLHLCGFGDKKADEKTEMRAAEDACLAEYFKQ